MPGMLRRDVVLMGASTLFLLSAVVGRPGHAQLPTATLEYGDVITASLGGSDGLSIHRIRFGPPGKKELLVPDVGASCLIAWRQVAVDDSGLVYLAGRGCTNSGIEGEAIIRWNPATGDADTIASSLDTQSFQGLEADAQFLYALLDAEILRIDLATEDTSSIPLPPELGTVRGFDLTAEGQFVLVSGDRVTSLDPSTGDQNVISSGGLLVEPSPGCNEATPQRLAVGVHGAIFVVLNHQGSETTCHRGRVTVVKVDPLDGSQADLGWVGNGFVQDAEVGATGYLVVATGRASFSEVVRIHSETGEELSTYPTDSPLIGLAAVKTPDLPTFGGEALLACLALVLATGTIALRMRR